MIDNIFLILLAVIPPMIFGFYIYKKDIVEKEPKSLLFKLLIFGFLSSGVALFLEDIGTRLISFISKDSVYYNIFYSFFVIALSEELSKWFFTYHYCWKNKAFDYMYDGIVYAAFVAIGFATVENVFAAISSTSDFFSVTMRGVFTVPLHIFMGVISGYYLGISKKYNNRGWSLKMKKPFILSIVIPVLIHGLFDYLVYFASKNTIVLSIMLIILLYILCFTIISRISNDNKKIVGNI